MRDGTFAAELKRIRDQDWDALLELNLTSSMVLTRALAPGMMQRTWGRILYISSVMGLASASDRVAYSTTKAALHGMVRGECAPGWARTGSRPIASRRGRSPRS